MAMLAIIENDVVVNIVVAGQEFTLPGFEIIPIENSGIAGKNYRRDKDGNWLPPTMKVSPQ